MQVTRELLTETDGSMHVATVSFYEIDIFILVPLQTAVLSILHIPILKSILRGTRRWALINCLCPCTLFYSAIIGPNRKRPFRNMVLN